MNEVEVDVEEVGLAAASADDVLLPNFLAKGLSHDYFPGGS